MPPFREPALAELFPGNAPVCSAFDAVSSAKHQRERDVLFFGSWRFHAEAAREKKGRRIFKADQNFD
jgi:hypothetical protein